MVPCLFTHGPAYRSADLVGISAGPFNTLQRRHPKSGVGLWTLSLEAPPVAVHLADGSSLNLYADNPLDSNNSMVVVGFLQDSLYALPVPADWLRSSLPDGPMQDASLQHGGLSQSQQLMLSGPEADRQGRPEKDRDGHRDSSGEEGIAVQGIAASSVRFVQADAAVQK